MTSRLTVVGCGTVVPEADRSASCFWVELGSSRVLLDCGPGSMQSLARLDLPWSEVTDLILTHFHGDHIGALPGLFFSLAYGLLPETRSQPLDVWGPPGTQALFEGLAAVLGDYFLHPGFEVVVRELKPGGSARLRSGVQLFGHKTPHTIESQAVRLVHEDVSVGYTGDTGPDPALGAFMQGVHVLVCECSLTEELVGPNHLSPSAVASMAQTAKPRDLLLTHVYPGVRAEVDVAELVRAHGYSGVVTVATEGWTKELV